MASLYTHQSRNIFRTWMLMSVFFVLVIAVGWFVSYYYNSPGILYMAAFFAVVMNITAYWFSDKIAIAAARAHPADEHEYRELHRVVENLAITAGLPKPHVFVIDDQAPNAFASGRDAAHAVIAVTTGLLATLDRSELEGVIAHELSHIGNRDILVMTVAVVLVGILSVLADIFLRMSFFGGGSAGWRSDRDNRGNPLIMVAGIIAIILAPIAAHLIQLAISRKREFLADASGALLTRYPDALASALAKIASYKAPMRHASAATAHLFISNPFGSSTGLGAGARTMGQFATKMFSTHPPISERIAALHGLKV